MDFRSTGVPPNDSCIGEIGYLYRAEKRKEEKLDKDLLPPGYGTICFLLKEHYKLKLSAECLFDRLKYPQEGTCPLQEAAADHKCKILYYKEILETCESTVRKFIEESDSKDNNCIFGQKQYEKRLRNLAQCEERLADFCKVLHQAHYDYFLGEEDSHLIPEVYRGGNCRKESELDEHWKNASNQIERVRCSFKQDSHKWHLDSKFEKILRGIRDEYKRKATIVETDETRDQTNS